MNKINLIVEPYNNINLQFFDVFYTARDSFERVYNKDWFIDDPLIIKMVEDIDRAKHLIQDVFTDQFGKNITPLLMSAGLKQLIMIYKFPQKLYDCKLMGANCFKYLPEICSRVGEISLVYYEAPLIEGIEENDVEVYFPDECLSAYTTKDAFFTAIDVRCDLMEKDKKYLTYYDRYIEPHIK